MTVWLCVVCCKEADYKLGFRCYCEKHWDEIVIRKEYDASNALDSANNK